MLSRLTFGITCCGIGYQRFLANVLRCTK